MPILKAGLLRYISECAISVVVIEGVTVHARDKDIRLPVVVVVSDGHPYVESGALQSSLFRHVGKYAVAIVAVETIPILRVIFFQGCEGSAIREEDVGPSIPIEIEYGNATGHGFRGVTCGTFVTIESKRKPLELKGNRRCGLLAPNRDNEDHAAKEDCAGETQRIEKTAHKRRMPRIERIVQSRIIVAIGFSYREVSPVGIEFEDTNSARSFPCGIPDYCARDVFASRIAEAKNRACALAENAELNGFFRSKRR
jgi:hypothetical protein